MTPEPRERPWEDLPRAVADLLRPELPALTEDIIAAIAREIPVYARPLEGAFGRGLRIGVEEALSRFVRLIAEPESGRHEDTEVYRALGRGEMQAGRSLDALQAAYRLGARVAWRRSAALGTEAGLPPDVLTVLAEAIFAYIDELAGESVEGYAEAQSAAAGERSRRRGRLLELLLAEPPADPEAVAEAAALADWQLPRALAAVALGPGVEPEGIARRIGPDVLAGGLPERLAVRLPASALLLVPDPAGPGRAGLVSAALRAPSAVGPATPPELAARSLTAAARLLALTGGDPPARAEEHLVALALDAAREPLEALAARRLAPLDDRAPAARRKLLETLQAWLELQGSAPAVARRLHVHPQTVRYRLARLREALGDALDDPEARFELQLAVRHRQLADAT